VTPEWLTAGLLLLPLATGKKQKAALTAANGGQDYALRARKRDRAPGRDGRFRSGSTLPPPVYPDPSLTLSCDMTALILDELDLVLADHKRLSAIGRRR